MKRNVLTAGVEPEASPLQESQVSVQESPGVVQESEGVVQESEGSGGESLDSRSQSTDPAVDPFIEQVRRDASKDAVKYLLRSDVGHDGE